MPTADVVVRTDNIMALTLPDPVEFKAKMQAIVMFQRIVRENLIPGQDFGTFPGIDKPTLFKPGAEKIVKLLELADAYEVEDKIETWTGNGFFHYKVKCRLIHIGSGKLISEGMGECNSYESKYRYRWVSESKLPINIDKNSLYSEKRKGKDGKGEWLAYRMDSEDVFSLVNTILKMAKKRALVDAALSAGRLSQLFTQDVEDLVANGAIETDHAAAAPPEPDKTKHWCKEHNTAFYMKGKMKAFAHPVKDAAGTLVSWCNEPEPPKTTEAKKEPAMQQAEPATVTPKSIAGVDMVWLKESLKTLHWTTVISEYLKPKFGCLSEKVNSCLLEMNEAQVKEFVSEVQNRLDMADTPDDTEPPIEE
jgi:hypothetical protein